MAFFFVPALLPSISCFFFFLFAFLLILICLSTLRTAPALLALHATLLEWGGVMARVYTLSSLWTVDRFVCVFCVGSAFAVLPPFVSFLAMAEVELGMQKCRGEQTRTGVLAACLLVYITCP